MLILRITATLLPRLARELLSYDNFSQKLQSCSELQLSIGLLLDWKTFRGSILKEIAHLLSIMKSVHIPSKWKFNNNKSMQFDKLVRFVAELTPVSPILRRPSIMIHCECKSPIYCAGKMDFYNPLLAHGCILLSLNGAFWLRNFRISLPDERSSKIDCLRRLDESAVIQLVHRNIKMDASVYVCLFVWEDVLRN